MNACKKLFLAIYLHEGSDYFMNIYFFFFQGTPIGTLLGGVRYSYAFDLLLETRASDEEFPVYEQGGM